MSHTLVVLLHGFTGGPASFDAVVEELGRRADDWEPCAPWLHGHGPASDLSAASFDGEVTRIAEIVRATRRGFSRVHLCGYSLGGRVALGLLALAPELFDSATVISAHPGLRDEDRDARRRWDAGWVDLLVRDGLEAFVARWSELPLFDSQRSLPGPVRAAQSAHRQLHDAANLASSLRVLGLGDMPNLRGALVGLQVPVQFVAGELDEKFCALGREMGAVVPRGSFMLARGCGHNVVLEAPGLVGQLLQEFLHASTPP